MNGQYEGRWEQRWHPLLREWIIVAAHRQDRPWSGERLAAEAGGVPPHDPDCRLCPGNERIGGARNPRYDGVFVFDNDRPSVAPEAPRALPDAPGPYRRRPADGVARVVCYTPRHDLTMAELGRGDVEAVVDAWRAQTRELAARDGVESVLIFENKGAISGVSNPHAHGQIYATNFRYRNIESHLAAAAEHHAAHGRVLYRDILETEERDGARVVAANATCVAFVPWFARYAYEVHVAPRATHARIDHLSDGEAGDFAALLHDTLIRMDNLWRMPFPYLLKLHQAPTDGADHPLFHFHVELYPPLRKPALRKYLGAHEIGGGNFVADTVPDDSAAALRAVPEIHYAAGRAS